MKTLKNIFFVSIAMLALLFSSCDDNETVRDPSPRETTGPQAFFSKVNPASYAFIPSDNPIFNVLVGRKNTKGQAVVKYAITDNDKVFVLADSVIFKDGVALDTIKVDFSKMAIGTTSTLSLKIDSLSTSIYGDASIEISVNRDYKWLDAGVVSMTSGLLGATANVSVQHADGTYIYRLVSPYYVLDPTSNSGYHIQFLLDNNYNAASLPKFQNIGEEASSGGFYWLYWNAAKSYCSFTNVGNAFTIKGAWGKGVSATTVALSSYATESFVWTKGYPGTN